MEDKKSYYAIIPANVRYDKRLKLLSRLIYGEITALCNEKGYCWATNKYFAELYEVSIQTISGCIAQLKEFGYISIEMIYREGSKEILNRYIKLFEYPIKENLNTPIKENFKDNNTVINNTLNNNIHISEHKSYGEYHNVYLTDKQKNAFECLVMNKEKAAEIIDSLSASIASNRDKVFDENFPEMHFIRLKVYWQNYKKRPKQQEEYTQASRYREL